MSFSATVFTVRIWYRRPRTLLYVYSNMDTDLRREDSDSDESDVEVGAQAPPLTKQISNILNRYPEGGQILKVTSFNIRLCYLYISFSVAMLNLLLIRNVCGLMQ